MSFDHVGRPTRAAAEHVTTEHVTLDHVTAEAHNSTGAALGVPLEDITLEDVPLDSSRATGVTRHVSLEDVPLDSSRDSSSSGGTFLRSGGNLWVLTGDVYTELSPLDDGEELMSSRHLQTGDRISSEDYGRLHAGDTLLLEVPSSWIDAYSGSYRGSRWFADVRRVKAPFRRRLPESKVGRFRLAFSILALLTLTALSTLSLVDLLPLAITIAYLLVGFGCLTLNQAWQSIGYRTVLTIATSFGPGAALTETSVSAVLGAALVELQVLGSWGFLFAIYLITAFVSCVISNSATVVAFYSVLRGVQVPGLSSEQILIVMMIGASSAFSTPIGYQTNLMVVARGGYKFGDFAFLGGGLILLVGVVVSSLALVFI